MRDSAPVPVRPYVLAGVGLGPEVQAKRSGAGRRFRRLQFSSVCGHRQFVVDRMEEAVECGDGRLLPTPDRGVVFIQTCHSSYTESF